MSLHALARFDGGVRMHHRSVHACAAVIEVDGEMPRRDVRYLGPQGTNNQAELQGMLLAMRMAAEIGVTHLRLRSDSRLIVEQALGNWRIKNAELAQMHTVARKYALHWFEFCEIDHIPREENTEADALVTKMLDRITKDPRNS